LECWFYLKYHYLEKQKERKMRKKARMNLPMMILGTAALGVMLWCGDATVRAEAQQQIGNRSYSVSDGDSGVIVS
jgi:hypothetical protein